MIQIYITLQWLNLHRIVSIRFVVLVPYSEAQKLLKLKQGLFLNVYILYSRLIETCIMMLLTQICDSPLYWHFYLNYAERGKFWSDTYSTICRKSDLSPFWGAHKLVESPQINGFPPFNSFLAQFFTIICQKWHKALFFA